MPVPENVKDPLIAVIDEGTELAMCEVYAAHNPKALSSVSVPIEQKYPREGWVEHDPLQILAAVEEVISRTFSCGTFDTSRIVTVGITNQRETTVVWDKFTGEPLYNAIVWSDIRTSKTVDNILARVPDNSPTALQHICGLPISPYFSAIKLRWLIDNVPAVRKAVKQRRCLFGTVDTWLIWNLTGGKNGGLHITDVTNASRTMMMNIQTLQWDPELLRCLNIPSHVLPEIRSSCEVYGHIKTGPLKGIPISGILGNQQASLVGELCLDKGQAKNTYRKGCFLIYNTGTTRVHSTHGLVTTVAYQLGPSALPVYALEGSVAVAGAASKWLVDKMNMMGNVCQMEQEASQVTSTGDVYFVPAFSGLYAPYWRKDARGIICGLTQFTTKHHIIRAALEAVCYQTRDILEAMHKDCGIPLEKLQVDGKMTVNNLLMQLQADLCGIPVERSAIPHIRGLGAAMVAGKAQGIDVWDLDTQAEQKVQCDIFLPTTTEEERNGRYTKWKMAVQRSLGWAITRKGKHMTEERYQALSAIPGCWFLMVSFGMLMLADYMEGS